jgi:hypothetical protein
MTSKDIAEFYLWYRSFDATLGIRGKFGSFHATANMLLFAIKANGLWRIWLRNVRMVDVQKYLCGQECRDASTVEISFKYITIQVGKMRINDAGGTQSLFVDCVSNPLCKHGENTCI